MYFCLFAKKKNKKKTTTKGYGQIMIKYSANVSSISSIGGIGFWQRHTLSECFCFTSILNKSSKPQCEKNSSDNSLKEILTLVCILNH